MSGSPRPFDDDRYPDAEGGACCFLCGRKVDPRDPGRGTYGIYDKTGRIPVHEPFPIHVSCADGKNSTQIEVAFRAAFNQMGANAVKRAREAARCAIVSPLGN